MTATLVVENGPVLSAGLVDMERYLLRPRRSLTTAGNGFTIEPR